MRTLILFGGGGFSLDVYDEGALDSWLQGPREMRAADIPQTPEARVDYLLNDLLVRNEWITLDDLAQILYVSRSAVSSDIKVVEQRLKHFGLSLEKRPHYGMRVAGPEIARRVCLANAIMRCYSAGGKECSQQAVPKLSGLNGTDLIELIDKCVRDAIDAEGTFHVNAMAYQNLLVHIAVALERISGDCQVPMPYDQLAVIKRSREYGVAERIVERLEERTDVRLPEEEVAYIAIHLAGKQTIDAVPDEPGSLVITDEVWSLVSDMLQQVWTVFRFDFRNELELRVNLARHIVPLIVRLRYHMELKNPMLADIKARYPLAYSMARDASAVVGVRYEASISDDEIGYIALAFALALERQKTPAAKKHVLVVCASGAGSARLLEWRVRQEFGDYVDRVTVCDVFDVPKMDFGDIDYVFTTVPLSVEVPVPVREVKFFLDSDEAESIKEFLSSASGFSSDILRYFSRDLFFPHLAGDTKDEVLDGLLDAVEKVKVITPRFRELVHERERIVATSFGNNVAIPHPLEPVGEETFVSVAFLDEPVVWDEFGNTVQAVFLSSFTDHDGLEVQKLYGSLSNLLVSRRAIERLVSERRWETFVALLVACAGGAPLE